MFKAKNRCANLVLNDRDDIRSSYFLEEVATEFDIQGLELGLTCACVGWEIYFIIMKLGILGSLRGLAKYK
jgi:hypothetical protein